MGRPASWRQDEWARARLRTFGEAVRAARLAKGVSQERLAFASGLDRTFVSAVERGVRNPSLLSAFALADALEIDVTKLVRPTEGAWPRPRRLDNVAESTETPYPESKPGPRIDPTP
ncbi:MAG: helix-turn-helix transcriptional regulator [Chloroflexi bacterium]|nr:helix-turn-helix transcriptional regulator [Chloroflexota bacterium]